MARAGEGEGGNKKGEGKAEGVLPTEPVNREFVLVLFSFPLCL